MVNTRLLSRFDVMSLNATDLLAGYQRLPLKLQSLDIAVARGTRINNNAIVRVEVRKPLEMSTRVVHKEANKKGTVHAIHTALKHIVAEQFGEDLVDRVRPISFKIEGKFDPHDFDTDIPAHGCFGFRGFVKLPGAVTSSAVQWHARSSCEDSLDAAVDTLITCYNYWIMVNQEEDAYVADATELVSL